jgi:hypothetical protein
MPAPSGSRLGPKRSYLLHLQAQQSQLEAPFFVLVGSALRHASEQRSAHPLHRVGVAG